VQTAECTGSGQQSWYRAPDKSIQVLGACLDSTGDTAQLRSCAGTPAQLWETQGDALASSGRCLDSVEGAVRVAACSRAGSQSWTVPGPASP
jgi:hypothetical protein